MPDQKEQVTPPYGSFATFQSFISHLNEKGVPDQIDASVMPTSFSGTGKSQIRTGLRFLGLTYADGQTTDKMRRLVAAYGTNEWKPTLAQIVAEAYKPVTGHVPIETASLRQLADAFRAINLQGSVLRKSIRFYLDALKTADIKFSAHFARGLSAAAGDRPKEKTTKWNKHPNPPTGVATSHSEQHTPLRGKHSEYPALPIPLPGREPVQLHVPADLSSDEWGLIDTMMRGYIALNSAKKKEQRPKADAP